MRRVACAWLISKNKFQQSRQQHSTCFRSLEKLREVKKEAVAAGHKFMFTRQPIGQSQQRQSKHFQRYEELRTVRQYGRTRTPHVLGDQLQIPMIKFHHEKVSVLHPIHGGLGVEHRSHRDDGAQALDESGST